MTQPRLFETPKLQRSPLCVREKHCGELAVYAEPVETESCINTQVTCCRCHKVGTISARKDLR